MAEVKTPIVYIYDPSRFSLVRNDKTLPIGLEVSTFMYKYQEEDGDKCTIIIDTDDIYLPDNIHLQDNSVLWLRWGFITTSGQELGPWRQVVILDTVTRYRDKGIQFEITATDYATHLKNHKDPTPRETTLEDFIQDVGVNVAYIVADELVGLKTPVSYEKNPNNGNLYIAQAIDNTSFVQHIRKDLIIDGGGKTTWAMLREELDQAPGGPYLLDGRDDTLTIRNRDFQQGAFRQYIYYGEDPRVLDFIPTTDNKTADKDKADVLAIDPETGERVSTQIIKEENRKNQIKAWLDQNVNGDYHESDSLRDQYEARRFDIENPDSTHYAPHPDVNVRIDRADDEYVEAGNANIITAISSTNVVQNIRIPGALMDHWFADLDVLKDALLNQMKEAEQKRHKAQLTIEGDPHVTSSLMFNMKGVARRHSGMWYFVNVTHRIQKGRGYVCECDCIKKPPPMSVIEEEFSAEWNDIKDALEAGNPISHSTKVSELKLLNPDLDDTQFLELVKEETGFKEDTSENAPPLNDQYEQYDIGVNNNLEEFFNTEQRLGDEFFTEEEENNIYKAASQAGDVNNLIYPQAHTIN